MRFSLLAGAALAALGVHASPMATLSKTGISRPDLSREGAITLHVIRTDDLVSDSSALLAERSTHIVLKIQLDPENAAVKLNDDKAISLAGHEGEAAFSVVKAETLTFADGDAAGKIDVDGTLLSQKQIEVLTEKALPQGVVSLEVAIKENKGESAKLLGVAGETLATSSQKVYDVLVKLLESEGLNAGDKSSEHVTMMHLPVLRIEVTKTGSQQSMRAWGLAQPTIAAQTLPGPPPPATVQGRPFRLGMAGAPRPPCPKHRGPHAHNADETHRHGPGGHRFHHRRPSFARRMRCAGRYWARTVRSAFATFSNALSELAETAPFALIGMLFALKAAIVLAILAVVRKNRPAQAGSIRLEDGEEVEVVIVEKA